MQWVKLMENKMVLQPSIHLSNKPGPWIYRASNKKAVKQNNPLATHFLDTYNSDGKESACSVGDPGDPWVGKIPWRGHGNPFQYSCVENSMDRGAWWATIHAVTKSRTWLDDFHFKRWKVLLIWKRIFWNISGFHMRFVGLKPVVTELNKTLIDF